MANSAGTASFGRRAPGRVLSALALLLGVATVGDAWAQAAGKIPGLVRRDPLHDVVLRGDDAWIVGFPGLVLASGDKGATFRQAGPGGAVVLLAVDRVDDKVGYACGRQGQVWKTVDGGATWALAEGKTETTEPLLALDFVDAERGFVVGNFGTVLGTVDGGKTWTAVQVLEEGEDPTLNGVAWVDASTVVVVGEMGVLARSTDAGATWARVEDVVPGHLFGVTALGNGGVLAVGSDGAIAYSRDGGATFQTVDSGVSEHLFRAAIAKGRVAISGAAGTMLVADDPAGPYTAVKVPTYLWIGSVALTDDGLGVAVGANAAVLVTRDFGRTWTRWGAK